MKCEDIKILMMEEIYDEIDKKNKEVLYNHLNNCSDCTAEYSDLKQTSSNLKLWQDENHEPIELSLKNTTPKKSKRIFYRIAAVAAAVLIILSLTNFRLSIYNNGIDIGFSIFGYDDTD